MSPETVEREPSERLVPSDRPPINIAMGKHPYVESEFPAGKGHCDQCGGGPDAEIHQPAIDQMARVADALERIAAGLDFLVEMARSEK